MKKLFISFVVAIMGTGATFAQNTLVATLSHGKDVTMFYGSHALKEAYDAAVSGDIINLSGGAFQSIDITKAISLRGVGIDKSNPTLVTGEFHINIPLNDANRLSIEGIRCAPKVTIEEIPANSYFLKSLFYEVVYQPSTDVSIKNVLFTECKITNSFYINGIKSSTTQLVNSYITNLWCSLKASAMLINCILDSNTRQLENVHIINSIITERAVGLYGSSTATNCIAINNDRLFVNSPLSTGCYFSSYEEVFKSYRGTYSDNETFELTSTAKTKFFGTDGSEIGMYGGILPYSSTPTYPQITKMKVANKTTTDGMLSVEMEVGAGHQ